jgi:hypothetical protein
MKRFVPIPAVVLLVLLVGTGTSYGQREFCSYRTTFAPLTGWTGSTGVSFNDETIGVSASITATALFINGTVEYTWWDAADMNEAVRGYAGLGLGPMLQIQLGIGEEGARCRFQTIISLKRICEGEGLWGYPKFENDDLFDRGAVLSAFCEIDEDGEVYGGVQLGFLIY